MRKRKPSPTKKFVQAIPMDCRDAVCDWLRASADNADNTASELRMANRTIQDPATAANAEHWEKVSACARLLAYQLETAGAAPRKPKREKPLERAK